MVRQKKTNQKKRKTQICNIFKKKKKKMHVLKGGVLNYIRYTDLYCVGLHFYWVAIFANQKKIANVIRQCM